MKILFVTLHAVEMNTSAMIRNRALIRGLIENNVKVDILTISPNKTNPNYDNTMDWNTDINIIRLKSNNIYDYLVKNRSNFISLVKGKILPVFRFIYHSFNLFDHTIYIAKSININELSNNYYDAIISSSDPKSSHYAVDMLIKQGLKYGTWIQYWGDPLTIDITNRSFYPKFYIKYKEKQLFSCADRIVYVSPLTFKEQKRIFTEFADKMSFIPIPYFEERFYDNINNKKIKIGYFGDYYSKYRNIIPLYEACNNMKNTCELLISGNSDLKLRKSDNIYIYPRVSQKEVEELESNCNILVCILNKIGTQIPGKIYHYAATNRPILVILDGERKEELKYYLTKFDRYILCDNNTGSIKKAIISIKSNNKEYYPSPYFNPKYVAKQFLDLIR